MNRILVVDDDENILKVLKMRLEANGYQVAGASGAEAAIKAAASNVIDLAVIDLRLNGVDGIELMERLHGVNPELPVIILTAYGAINSAVDAMQKGAYSYLTKPFDDQELLLQVQNGLEKCRLSNEVRNLKNMVHEKYGFDNIIGNSGKMKKVFKQIALAAAADSNVYIEGESGTGKELVAKTLHVASSRKDEPFVAINCAAIPEPLLESELFGFERGAFTGAVHSKKGLFSMAGKGTLFLDEITEMPMSMQAKLLRVLQELEFYTLGGRKVSKLEARLISASNKDIEKEIEAGRFRRDLFYRIYVIPVKLPPLRERKESIPLLARHFLAKYSKKMNKEIKAFSSSAIQKLFNHSWPGNVRELENAVECAVAMADQDVITGEMILQTQPVKNDGIKPFKDAKEDFERKYVIQLLELTQGNVSQSAQLAGKYRADFYDILKKHDLDPEDFRARSIPS